MGQIDTNALSGVSPALGVGNPSSATVPVEFDDANLQQVLDVGGLVSRARAPYPSSGIFAASIYHEHTGSNMLTTTVNPYKISDTAGFTTQSPWPDPVPEDMDVWLLGCSGFAENDNVSAASVQIICPKASVAWTNHGPPFFGESPMYCMWDDSQSKGDGERPMTSGSSSSTRFPTEVYINVPMRLRRDSSIRWRTDANSVNGYMVLAMRLGLFPAGFGQDADL